MVRQPISLLSPSLGSWSRHPRSLGSSPTPPDQSAIALRSAGALLQLAGQKLRAAIAEGPVRIPVLHEGDHHVGWWDAASLLKLLREQPVERYLLLLRRGRLTTCITTILSVRGISSPVSSMIICERRCSCRI